MDATDEGRTSSPAEDLDTLVGRTLGDFRLRERLEGTGSDGKVYLADQPALDREVVVKVLRSGDRSGGGAQRFLREAHLASRLDHPFAAHIYAFGAEPDGLLWIAMERVRGISLDRLLATQGALPLSRFVPLLERICEVVAAAHEQGITHRDIKPANVMVVARAGQLSPKLLDFGIAKARAPVDALQAEESSRTGPPDEASNFALTNPQRYVGTPHYMSPEHWLDASRADARSDLYALGIMSFQLLTGTLPFDGPSLDALSRAHASQPLPPLGAPFPPALDDVLQKATAKDPSARYASALDFARAVTAATGLEPSLTLLQLPADLREQLLHEAPQPIAEAVAMLEAARQLTQAQEALTQVNRVCARWVGVLALAARARVSASDAMPATYAELANDGPNDRQWWELARELCRPFEACREVHPVPELVDLFFPREAGVAVPLGPTSGVHPVDERVPPEESWARALNRLETLLRSLLLIFRYEVCVARAGGAERWRGVRRRHRSRFNGPTRVAEGQVFLADRDGSEALVLSPLVQCMAPAPAEPEELFFVHARGRHGARLVALPLALERQDEELFEWLAQRLAPLPGVTTAVSEKDQAPYLGLASFSVDDAERFIGREEEAEGFANRLRTTPLLAVVGPSGSGKSSFIQAGVRPLLGEFIALTVRPGPAPLEALAARLAQEEDGAPDAAALRERPALLGETLRELASVWGRRILLVVDQFEEVLTLGSEIRDREAYAQALCEATSEGAEGPVRVVLTLRDDFLVRTQQLSPFRAQLGRALHLLGTPAPADLLRILEVPARRAGFAFEDPELPLEMVHEVQAQPSALALLSFTASKLWELRDRHLQLMTRTAYRALGGVGGALAQHAEATLAAMPSEDLPKVREAFRSLVTAEGTRAVLSRRELVELLSGPTGADRVLEALIQARLLVAFEGTGGDDRIELVHEALLATWPRLGKWMREDAENVRLRDALRAAARQWEERRRKKGLLWRGDALLEYRLWRARYVGALTDSEKAFAAASLAEERRERRMRRALVLGAMAVLGGVAVALARLNHVARRSESEVRNRLAEQYADQGRRLLLAGEPLKALAYLESGFRLGAADPATRFLLARGQDALRHVRGTLPHPAAVLGLDYHPDGTRVATAGEDGAARIWEVQGATLLYALRVSRAGNVPVWSVRFSPDGRTLAAGAEDGTVALWDAARGAAGPSVQVCKARVDKLAFHPTRPWLLASCFDGTAPLLDATTLAPVHAAFVPETEAQDPTPVTAVFSPEGRWGAVATPRAILLHDFVNNRTVLREPRAGGSSLLAFSPDGARLAIPENERIRIWTLADLRLEATLEEHGKELVGVAFGSEPNALWSVPEEGEVALWSLAPPRRVRGSRHWATLLVTNAEAVLRAPSTPPVLLIASQTGAAELWDANSGEARARLHGHSAPIRAARFSADGEVLATASLDHSVRLWSSRALDPLQRLSSDGPVVAVAFGRSGEGVTLSEAGSVTRWKLGSGEALGTRAVRPAPGAAMALSPRGDRLARCSGDGTLTEEGIEPDATPRMLALGGATCATLRWSDDGAALAIGTVQGSVVLRRVRDGKESLQTLTEGREVAAQRLTTVAVSDDNRFVAAAGYAGRIPVWSLPDGVLVATLPGHTGPVLRLAWSPRGERLVSLAADGQARVWSLPSGGLAAILEESPSIRTTAAFLAGPELLVTGSQGGALEVWSARDGHRLWSFSAPGPVSDLAVSADGRELFVGALSGHAGLWSTRLFTGTPADLAPFVACHVPYALEGAALVARATRCSAPAP